MKREQSCDSRPPTAEQRCDVLGAVVDLDLTSRTTML